jgi:hypothetical protein
VPEATTDTALVSEVGRRLATSVQYCEPAPAGEIVVPTGRFSVSVEPTRHLFLKFNFDFTDAPNSAIREVAVFVGTQTSPGLPLGQLYFTQADIVNPGILLVTERMARFDRSPSVRQSFEFVVTF